jgi:hypothetical protein
LFVDRQHMAQGDPAIQARFGSATVNEERLITAAR